MHSRARPRIGLYCRHCSRPTRRQIYSPLLSEVHPPVTLLLFPFSPFLLERLPFTGERRVGLLSQVLPRAGLLPCRNRLSNSPGAYRRSARCGVGMDKLPSLAACSCSISSSTFRPFILIFILYGVRSPSLSFPPLSLFDRPGSGRSVRRVW